MELKIDKNVPYPSNSNKELVDALMGLNVGESTYLYYADFSKTTIRLSINTVRIRMKNKNRCIKTLGDAWGIRIWVFPKVHLK